MADSKITALTALTAADPANDMFPVVDVSDTTMAASGTTKRISINNILACSPSATLASATITGAATVGTTLAVTGDLAVRTNKLVVTSTGVGIGTTSPLIAADIRSGGDNALVLLRTTDPAASVCSPVIRTPVSTGYSSTVPVYGFWYQGCGMGNPASETLSWILGSSEKMRLSSSGLGVGVDPAVAFDVLNVDPQIRLRGTGTTSEVRINSAYGAAAVGGIGTVGAHPFIIYTSNTERVRVKSTGQVRFVPLAADPSGAETGDVYYNSSSNKLKCYNGTIWNDLF